MHRQFASKLQIMEIYFVYPVCKALYLLPGLRRRLYLGQLKLLLLYGSRLWLGLDVGSDFGLDLGIGL